jgi:hypothetical protein
MHQETADQTLLGFLLDCLGNDVTLDKEHIPGIDTSNLDPDNSEIFSFDTTLLFNKERMCSLTIAYYDHLGYSFVPQGGGCIGGDGDNLRFKAVRGKEVIPIAVIFIPKRVIVNVLVSKK